MSNAGGKPLSAPDSVMSIPSPSAASSEQGQALRAQMHVVLGRLQLLAESPLGVREAEHVREALVAAERMLAEVQPGREDSAPATTPPLPTMATAHKQRAPRRPWRLLLADDVEAHRKLVRAFLHGSGWQVLEVADGEAAVLAWERERPDVVLLDGQMPGLDGHAAARSIRRRELVLGRPPTPLVMLTAGNEPRLRAESLAAGITCHVEKPFQRERLLQLLRSLVQPAAGEAQAIIAALLERFGEGARVPILKLREDWKAQEGANYSLRRFHDEFLRHGAAGSSGTVTEPYAIQAKFPTPFIQTVYAHGYTLGEAFYQSVSGPYQLLIVGDALGLDPGHWRDDPRLAELGYGAWEGFSWKEIEAHTPNALADWRADPEGFCPPGGETHHALRQRSHEALLDIAAAARRTVIVGHGVSGAVMRGLNLGLDARAMFVLEKPQDAFFRLTAGAEERIVCS